MAKHKKTRKLLGTAPGPIGTVPYSEEAVVWESVGADFVSPSYREFMQTDARTIMLVANANHWNFIPNPSMRMDSHGWEATGFAPSRTDITDLVEADGDAGGNRTKVMASPAMNAQVVAVSYLGRTHYLVKKDVPGVSLAIDDCPFPIDQPLDKFAVWNPVEDSLSDDSWVGRSLLVNGSGTIRYRQNGYYVYVGAASTEDEDSLFLGKGYRGSSEWRFSARFKGTGKVVMRMYAHKPVGSVVTVPEPGSESNQEDPPLIQSDQFMPPPLYWDSPRVSESDDPSSWPISEEAVVVESPDGGETVWIRRNPPYYSPLGFVRTVAEDPTTLTPLDVMPSTIQSTEDGSVWEIVPVFDPSLPFYTRWGIPAEVDDPLSATASDKYVRDGSGTVWVSSGTGYVPTTMEKDRDPARVLPDIRSLPPYLLSGGKVYRYDRIPTAAPWTFYTDLGAYTVLGKDEPGAEDMEPGPEFVLDAQEQLWIKDPPPYFVYTGNSTWFRHTSTQVHRLSDPDDWTMLSVRTGHTEGTSATTAISFAGAWWIDTVIEIEDAVDLKVSSLLLDPNEFPIAEYFDGSMTEREEADDYIWEGNPNDSPSMYFYERKNRLEWLHDNLRFVAPFRRPYQIFQGSRRKPFVPESYVTNLSLTDETQVF